MKRRFLCAVPRTAALAMLLAALTAPPALAVEPARESSPRDRAAAGRESRSRAQVDLVVTSITPKSIAPRSATAKSPVTVEGYIRNRTGQPLTGLSIQLRYSATPLGSRGELAQFAGTSPPTLPGVALRKDFTLPLPDGNTSWRLETTAQQLEMHGFGVYPIAVEVVNNVTDVLIAARATTLVYAGAKSTPKPTKIAWVWPVIDRPHRASDTLFLDDQLETSLRDGRLAGLVDAADQADGVPLTWAVDPALLDDARAMANGYTLRTVREGKRALRERKTPSTAARRWLADLRETSRSQPYFTVPYADPDPVALVGEGMRKHLSVAYRHMDMVAQPDLLDRPAQLKIAWPPTGADQDTLDQMARLKSKAFLLNGQTLPSPDQSVTPDATTRLEAGKGHSTAIGYDATLSKVVSGSTKYPGDALLAGQRFLAETAMITAERPNEVRTVVVAPDRRWNPGPGFAASLLESTDTARWLAPVGLETALKARPTQRTFTGFPDTESNRNLSARYLQKVREIANRAVRFATIFNPPTNNYELAVLRTESSYWRGHTDTAFRRREIISSELSRDIAKIRVVSNRTSLAGNSGTMPITVANDLAVGKVTIRLEVISRTPARLRIGKPDRDQVTLLPRQKFTFRVPLQAFANGNTDVEARLLTPDGKEFGKSKVIDVRTTGYGRTALMITAGGLAVLFLGVGIRVLRAKRRHNRTEGTRDGRPTGAGSSPDDATAGPGLDHGADTAVDAIDPVATTGAEQPEPADGADQADGGTDSPVPSTSGTDAGSTANNTP